ncbi:hypothetical protein [Kutzneria chonburiensis]|uniref:PH domain-containing protein n=1 Tax=Kutzneria chonburiensis TaxID=1483604 RepID=A0ABV6N0N7_9PSEU|nr:hypothetical protein [Kutzneria chonburiensis]
METIDDFGAVLSKHPVNNKRRLVTGFWALAIGAVGTVLGGYLFVTVDDTVSYALNRNVGVTLGIGLVGLWIAAISLGRALRGGSDEYFEVRQHGLVHATARQVRGWTWDSIDDLVISRSLKETALSQRLGGGRVLVSFDNGQKARFDNTTADRYALEDAIRSRYPGVVRAERMDWARKVGSWWLAFAAVFLAAGIWMVVTIANSKSEQIVDTGSGTTAIEITTVSDAGYVWLAVGLVVCALGLITSASFYFTYRR